MQDQAASGSQRACGDCHLCCRVYPVPEVGKDHTDWCPRLDPAQGCRAYEERPQRCREFSCLWQREGLPEDWRPDRAGFVLSDPEPWHFVATCDRDRPQAWRREPFASAIRDWSVDAARQARFGGVREGAKLYIVFEDREVALDEEGARPDDGTQ